jgi:OmpA-OmpF porin, OOP family
VFFNVGVGDPLSKITRNGAGGEALLTARVTLGPVWLGAGGGFGIGASPGTPRYRLFASLGASLDTLARSPFDEDPNAGKGRGDKGAPGPGTAAPGPAPPLDRDGDGVPDAEDACPMVVGDASPTARRRGCPPDRDGDGIFDTDDRCPDKPGVASDVPEKNGCPPDTDGDGIVDPEDACPNEKGKPSADPRAHGCPTAVRIEGTQIVILQQVNFETGRDVIKPDSFSVLQQVADVLKDHPDIARLAVDGHTDNVGAEKANLLLSQRRALSVVRWLTDHGVDARRLEARGFGPRRPIADNKTDAGKAKNRRVEFQIRRRTPEGEAGWRDGPLD